jgi:hypothetical protein
VQLDVVDFFVKSVQIEHAKPMALTFKKQHRRQLFFGKGVIAADPVSNTRLFRFAFLQKT